jgi:hypothetical protein
MTILMKLKAKYRTKPTMKNPKRTKVGNSGGRTKAELRGPRVPVSLNLAGARGWKPEYEV